MVVLLWDPVGEGPSLGKVLSVCHLREGGKGSDKSCHLGSAQIGVWAKPGGWGLWAGWRRPRQRKCHRRGPLWTLVDPVGRWWVRGVRIKSSVAGASWWALWAPPLPSDLWMLGGVPGLPPWAFSLICTHLVMSSNHVVLNTSYALMTSKFLSPDGNFPWTWDKDIQLLFQHLISVPKLTCPKVFFWPLPFSPTHTCFSHNVLFSFLANNSSISPVAEIKNLGAMPHSPLSPITYLKVGTKPVALTSRIGPLCRVSPVQHRSGLPRVLPRSLLCLPVSLLVSSLYGSCISVLLICEPVKIHCNTVSSFGTHKWFLSMQKVNAKACRSLWGAVPFGPWLSFWTHRLLFRLARCWSHWCSPNASCSLPRGLCMASPQLTTALLPESHMAFPRHPSAYPILSVALTPPTHYGIYFFVVVHCPSTPSGMEAAWRQRFLSILFPAVSLTHDNSAWLTGGVQ